MQIICFRLIFTSDLRHWVTHGYQKGPKLTADAAHMEIENRPETAPKGGRKVRLRTLADLDRRTNAAKATFDLRDRLVADLGGSDHLTAMHMEIIDNVAVMGAMLKDAAAGYLTGEPTDIAEYTTLANAQRRLLADLGLERRSRDITPSLGEYLATKAAEKAKAGGAS